MRWLLGFFPGLGWMDNGLGCFNGCVVAELMKDRINFVKYDLWASLNATKISCFVP